jgi:hypothetical protein
MEPEQKDFRLAPEPAGRPVGDCEERPQKKPPPEASDPPPEAKAPAARARVRCPVCDGSGREAPAGADPGYVRCEGCGTWFLKKRPSLGQLASDRDGAFENAFALPHHELKRRSHDEALEVMRGFFGIRRKKPVALNAFGKKVLVVECDLGFRLRAFESYGWMASGTETAPTAFEYARRQSLDVKQGWPWHVAFAESGFDLTLFCGNFGSVPDPLASIEKLHDLLKLPEGNDPGGLVCVLREPLAPADPNARVECTGLFRYTAGSLKRLFCDNRFFFVSEEIAEGTGTFWFQAKSRS